MKVMITGATSMIGAAFANRLTGAGHEVYAVVRGDSNKISSLKPDKNLKIVECSMESYSGLSSLAADKMDMVFAAAWNGTRGSGRNDPGIQRANYQYNTDLLQYAVRSGCKKFITAGSQAEYGSLPGEEKVTEETVPHPDTEYGKYKLLFYEHAGEVCARERCTLLEPRFFSIYGPADYQGSFVISTLKKMIKNEPCDLTECIQLWDFLYIDDAAEGLMALINSSAEGIYNFGSGYSQPLRKFVGIMQQVTGSSSQINYGRIPYPPSGIVNLNPCVEKLKKTGWMPVTAFAEGIERILRSLEPLP